MDEERNPLYPPNPNPGREVYKPPTVPNTPPPPSPTPPQPHNPILHHCPPPTSSTHTSTSEPMLLLGLSGHLFASLSDDMMPLDWWKERVVPGGWGGSLVWHTHSLCQSSSRSYTHVHANTHTHYLSLSHTLQAPFEVLDKMLVWLNADWWWGVEKLVLWLLRRKWSPKRMSGFLKLWVDCLAECQNKKWMSMTFAEGGPLLLISCQTTN